MSGSRWRQCAGMLLAIGVHLPLVFLFTAEQAVGKVQWRGRSQPALVWLSTMPFIARSQSRLLPARVPDKALASARRANTQPRPALAPARAARAPGATLATMPAAEPFLPAPAPEAARLLSDLAAFPAEPMPVSADEIRRKAKDSIAKISRELSSEFPERGRSAAPLSTQQSRLEKGFADAHAAARPNWYQAAKIEEISDGAGSGARVYRVVTAFGTFCITYPKSGKEPIYSNCL
jgi:hypothetical protein